MGKPRSAVWKLDALQKNIFDIFDLDVPFDLVHLLYAFRSSIFHDKIIDTRKKLCRYIKKHQYCTKKQTLISNRITRCPCMANKIWEMEPIWIPTNTMTINWPMLFKELKYNRASSENYWYICGCNDIPQEISITYESSNRGHITVQMYWFCEYCCHTNIFSAIDHDAEIYPPIKCYCRSDGTDCDSILYMTIEKDIHIQIW